MNKNFSWDSCAPEAIIRALNGECTDIFNERYDYSNTNKESNENTLGLIMTLENHHFYFKYLAPEIKTHVWNESLKPRRQK